jgi:HD-like signal output (HDOD) protein
VSRLGSYDLPVLRRTALALAELREREDSLTARDLGELLVRDPLMAVKVLRYSQSRLAGRQPTEITTVEHAIMMHGVAGFFRQFAQLKVLEDLLAPHPEALSGALAVASRAHHAALTARNFAALRHDIEGDEVTISALLHDLAELLIWCVAPAAAMQLDCMLAGTKGLRSASAQKITLGFTAEDLQLALAREWRLPKLLQALMDSRQAGNPRVQTVRLCVALARHSAHGWYDPALPDDYVGLQKLVNLPAAQTRRWINVSALQAARAWRHVGVKPAAAWLPMLPGEWPAPQAQATPAAPGSLVDAVLEQLSSAHQHRADVASILAVALYGMHAGLGLRRCWFGIRNAADRVEPLQAIVLEGGLAPQELAFSMASGELFARLMERTQSMWGNPANRDKLAPLIPPGIRARLTQGDFVAMSLHVKGAPYGLIYADTGGRDGVLDQARYNAFKRIGVATQQALEHAA